MATAYGSKSSKRKSVEISVANIAAAAADAGTIVIPAACAGYLDINASMGRVTTSIANATPVGTIVIQHTPSGGSASTVGTYTVANADDAGDLIVFVPASGYESGVNLAAGDTITVAHTQETGGSAAGAVNVYVEFDMYKL